MTASVKRTSWEALKSYNLVTLFELILKPLKSLLTLPWFETNSGFTFNFFQSFQSQKACTQVFHIVIFLNIRKKTSRKHPLTDFMADVFLEYLCEIFGKNFLYNSGHLLLPNCHCSPPENVRKDFFQGVIDMGYWDKINYWNCK